MYSEDIFSIFKDFEKPEIKSIEIYYAKLKYFEKFEIATGVKDYDEIALFIVSDGEFFGIGETIFSDNIRSFEGYEHLKDPVKFLASNVPDNIRLGFEMAYLDLLARKNGIRFGNLFDKDIQNKILTDVTIGIKPLESVLDDVRKFIDMGFKRIKLKMGIGNFHEERKKLIHVIDALKNGVKLRIDANQGWSVKTAKLMVNVINEYSDVIELLEQPLRKDLLEEMDNLRKNLTVPLIVDESIRKLSDLEKVRDYVDGINIKISKAGSITEAFMIGRKAIEYGLRVMIGCSFESNIGITADTYLASVIPVEFADLDSDLMKQDVVYNKVTELKDSFRILPNKHGLGIEKENINAEIIYDVKTVKF